MKNRLEPSSKKLLKVVATHIKSGLSPLFKELHESILPFNPPENPNFMQSIFYKMYAEKLYEIRFAYFEWESKYDFEIHEV